MESEARDARELEGDRREAGRSREGGRRELERGAGTGRASRGDGDPDHAKSRRRRTIVRLGDQRRHRRCAEVAGRRDRAIDDSHVVRAAQASRRLSTHRRIAHRRRRAHQRLGPGRHRRRLTGSTIEKSPATLAGFFHYTSTRPTVDSGR